MGITGILFQKKLSVFNAFLFYTQESLHKNILIAKQSGLKQKIKLGDNDRTHAM